MSFPDIPFSEFVAPNRRPYTLGPDEDANLVGMRLYGRGPFHRELKPAMKIRKKSHFVIRAGDVIYNKLFAWKGTFGIVPDELDGMFVSDKFPTYELDDERTDVRYLLWYFKTPRLWEQARGLSKGSAALSKLTLNPPQFLELTIPLPPLAEQRRIVARIEALAARIEEARSLRREAEEMSRALVDAGVRAVLQPAPDWAKASLAECTTMSTGTTPPTSRPDYYGGTLQWYTPGDLELTKDLRPATKTVSDVAIAEGKVRIYERGMVLWVGIGGSLGKVGLARERCSSNQQITGIRFSEEIDSEYGFWWMRGLYGQLRAAAPQATLPILSQGRLGEFPIAYPGLTEQRRIVARLDDLQARADSVKQLHSQTAAELDALLPSILDKAFKGEL